MTPSEEKQAYEQMVQKVRTPSAEEKEEAMELQKELTKEDPLFVTLTCLGVERE